MAFSYREDRMQESDGEEATGESGGQIAEIVASNDRDSQQESMSSLVDNSCSGSRQIPETSRACTGRVRLSRVIVGPGAGKLQREAGNRTGGGLRSETRSVSFRGKTPVSGGHEPTPGSGGIWSPAEPCLSDVLQRNIPQAFGISCLSG